MKETIEPLFIDMSELVRLTGLSHDTLSRLARRQQLPGAFKIPGGKGARGDRWRFRKVQTLKWVANLGVK